VHDTSGVTSALMSGGFAGLSEVTSCTSLDGTASYSYDPTGELLAAHYTSPLPSGEGQGEGVQPDESYTYDANGNRMTASGSAYVTGADNRLLFDGTYTYAYDAEGNRTAKFIDANHDGVLDAGDTDVTEFTWDNRDRLTEVKTYATEGGSPTEVVDYLYDVENRWIGENIFSPLPSGEGQGEGFTEHQIRFAYDGNEIVLQFDKDGSGTLDASNLSHRYLWQPGAVDQLMSDEQLSGSVGGQGGYDLTTAGKVVFTLGDNQGTIRDLAVMASGVTSVVNHRVFDSFGNLTSQTNSAVDCLFGYTGLPFDKASGTYRSATRPYDPTTGQWLEEDWIGFKGGDTNLYRYCGNSPTNATDPSGLFPGLFTVENAYNWYVKQAFEKSKVTVVKQQAQAAINRDIARAQNTLVGDSGKITLKYGQGQGASAYAIAAGVDLATVEIRWFIRQLNNGQMYVDYTVLGFDPTGKLINSWGGFYPKP
jgi:RHS repeat-associated protein